MYLQKQINRMNGLYMKKTYFLVFQFRPQVFQDKN